MSLHEWGEVLAIDWGGCGGAGGEQLGRSTGWSGRAGRHSALPPPLLGAGRWAGRSVAWGSSWGLVPLRARTSCLSAGSGSLRSSVPFASSASKSLVLLRNLGAVVCCLASCNGKVVSLRVPGLHSYVLMAPHCCCDYLGCPDCRGCGPGHSRGCTPFRSAGLQTFPGVIPASWFPFAWAFLSGSWVVPAPVVVPAASVASIGVFSTTISSP